MEAERISIRWFLQYVNILVIISKIYLFCLMSYFEPTILKYVEQLRTT